MTAKNTADLNAQATTTLADNTTGDINESDVRQMCQDIIDSMVNGLTDRNLTAGYTTTADDDGLVSAGTYTPSPVGGNLRRYTNGGAHTFAAPTEAGDYALTILVTNNASAGAITLSGFNDTSGDPFTTTNGHHFKVYIDKINSVTSAFVKAQQ